VALAGADPGACRRCCSTAAWGGIRRPGGEAGCSRGRGARPFSGGWDCPRRGGGADRACGGLLGCSCRVGAARPFAGAGDRPVPARVRGSGRGRLPAFLRSVRLCLCSLGPVGRPGSFVAAAAPAGCGAVLPRGRGVFSLAWGLGGLFGGRRAKGWSCISWAVALGASELTVRWLGDPAGSVLVGRGLGWPWWCGAGDSPAGWRLLGAVHGLPGSRDVPLVGGGWGVVLAGGWVGAWPCTALVASWVLAGGWGLSGFRRWWGFGPIWAPPAGVG